MTTEEILRANLTDEQYNAVVDESISFVWLALVRGNLGRLLIKLTLDACGKTRRVLKFQLRMH